MNNIDSALYLSTEIADRTILRYLECIAKCLLGKDTSESEAIFNELLKEGFNILWDFNKFESWLEEANIDEGKKKFIRKKTELLKQKL